MGQVLTPDALIQEVRQVRAAGRSIAFANGCFDLLHVGHVRYLEGAADEADLLVVAIDDDVSVHALKGAGRPVLAAEHRAELVAALRCVDYAIVLPRPAVGSLLEVLRPEVYCVGADDLVDTVPARETVQAYGGRIAIVGGPKDHSSRDLLTRISASISTSIPTSAPTGVSNSGGGQ